MRETAASFKTKNYKAAGGAAPFLHTEIRFAQSSKRIDEGTVEGRACPISTG